MRIASFDDHRIGVIIGDEIVDVTSLLDVPPPVWPPVGMVQFIAAFASDLGPVREAAKNGPRRSLSEVRLNAPVEWPNKLLAYPANYTDHIVEMNSGYTSRIKGFFLKASSSLVGPSGPIVRPAIPGASIHHEAELAIVIGRGGRSITREDAIDHIFGYSCLLDITVRGDQERVMRKSFDTFTPMGPWIVTADEIGAPDELDIVLTVNGEVRQSANTRDLLLDIPGMIEMASSAMTLHAGDVIATGTPAGVGPIEPGDVVEIRIGGVGEMRVPVVEGRPIRNIAFEAAS